MACEKRLSAGINEDICTENPVKGAEEVAYIFNYEDLTVTYDANNETIASNIVAAVGTKGYPITMTGETPFTGTKTEMQKKQFGNVFDNTFAFSVLADSPANAAKVGQIARGKFAIAIEKIGIGSTGASRYKFYGLQSGLRAETAVQDSYADNSNGGWEITLKETSVQKPAVFLFDGNAGTTATKFASLID